MAVAGVGQGLGEGGFDGVDGRGGGVEPGLDIGELTCDAVLLGFEQIERDGVGVVGAEQLGALGQEVVALDGQVVAFTVSFVPGARQLAVEHGGDVGHLSW
ncbi:hypothetical protein [Tsukamurella sp. NPDC003166]|uniref:hypothetical protein n=1 Tax=Tsukamurella sp. NPDC003166 TaxID=3154444 RepID=UPI0033B6EEDB